MDFSKMDRGQITVAATGISVMLTLHFTFQLLSQHMFFWKNPTEQKAILIIIMVAPIYAVDSFVGLLDIQSSKSIFMLLGSFRECYEALAIAKFLGLMYCYLKISMNKNIFPDEIKGREIHHLFPMTLFLPRKTCLNHQTLRLMEYWTWQFVIVRPICSVMMVVLHALGIYPSWLGWTFTIILSFSISLAMYSLVVFYHVFAKELEPHKPLSKFICIQGIVFFCFWQGLVLDMLVSAGILGSNHFWLDTEDVGESLHKILICIEMVFFSVLQQYAYHVSPYSGDIESKLKLQRKYD